MDFLFSIPYLPYIVGGVVLFFIYQQVAPRLSLRAPRIGLDDIMGKLMGPGYAAAQTDRMAKKYRKEGHFLAAGKLFEDAGKLAEAVDAYVEGQEYWAAASVLEKMGKREKAGEMYLKAGDYKKGAQLLADAGKHAQAAALFQEKGNNLEAARLYGLAGAWEKAAELYAKSGYPLRAAEAYEKNGDFLKAAQCHEQHFMENVTYSTTYSSTAPSADVKSALRAGRLYEKAGDMNRALQIYSRGGYFKEAADASMSLGQFAKAAELYLRAEDPGSAADAYDRASDPVKAANLRGEAALKADRVPEAAAFFQKGKDYLRAAELFESVGMLAEAAGAYEAGESHAAAGSVYLRAGLKERAAASYERAGEYETSARLYEEAGNRVKAVELYEKAGFTFKSGEAAAQAGDRAKAIALLQRVLPDDEDFRAATELLARLLIESGKPGLAVERIQKVLAGQPVTRSDLDLYYWLAVSHEVAGQVREALEVYRRIQAEDLDYADVERRMARLEAGGPPEPPPPLAKAAAPPAVPPAPPAVPPAPPRASAPAAPSAAQAAPAPRPPSARFVTRDELGRGPLGVVFRGEDRTNGRSVALRILPETLLQAEGIRRAVVADLKAAAQISHPNLVRVLGLVELDGRRCVVTELVTGSSLAEALRKGQRMPPAKVLSLGRALAEVLAFIHGKGVVHGSIQPSNVMAAAGSLKVADLGLGRLAHSLPPEQTYRAPSCGFDAAGDLHALASLLYHLLTGVHPRSHPPGSDLPPPSKAAPGIPGALDDLLLRSLEPRVELRPASASAVLEELRGVQIA